MFFNKKICYKQLFNYLFDPENEKILNIIQKSNSFEDYCNNLLKYSKDESLITNSDSVYISPNLLKLYWYFNMEFEFDSLNLFFAEHTQPKKLKIGDVVLFNKIKLPIQNYLGGSKFITSYQSNNLSWQENTNDFNLNALNKTLAKIKILVK